MIVKVNSVNMAYGLSTFGTSTMGYIERKGIVVNLTNGQKILGYYVYSSKGYGNFHEVKNPSTYSGLNERFLPKYNKYKEPVNKHFNEIFSKLKNKLEGRTFNNVNEIKRILRNPH